MLVYNSDVSVPLSISHEGAVTCQSSNILEYCEFDCASGEGGIACSCTSDGQSFDPELLDDPLDDCKNSPLLSIPQTDFTLVAKKQRVPISVQMMFSNAGDRQLQWNLTKIRATHGVGMLWSVAPSSGHLIGCDLGTVEVALSTWNMTARADAYELHLELTSNSYKDAARNVSVRAFVSAEPDPTKSRVTLQSAPVLASSTLSFTITAVDSTGLEILDAPDTVYQATLFHILSSEYVTCSVLRYLGECDLSALSKPFAGDFVLQVLSSSGRAVGGGDGKYNFNVSSCPASYLLVNGTCICDAGFYDSGDACAQCQVGFVAASPGARECTQCDAAEGETSNSDHTLCNTCLRNYYFDEAECKPCPAQVVCHEGSRLEDWQLRAGYWRESSTSEHIFACRFDDASCPGYDSSAAVVDCEPDDHCACGYLGPLCSECDTTSNPIYFQSWTGGGCEQCDDGQSHTPSVVLGVVVLTFGAGLGALVGRAKSKYGNTAWMTALKDFRQSVKVKLKILFFMSQVSRAQQEPHHTNTNTLTFLGHCSVCRDFKRDERNWTLPRAGCFTRCRSWIHQLRRARLVTGWLRVASR